MAQYKIGSVTVTNGSQTITGLSTTWLADIAAGDIFTVIGSNVWYEVGSVDSDTQITLAANYAGSTASSQGYAITRDFTPLSGLPYVTSGDIETAAVIKRAMLMLDSTPGGGNIIPFASEHNADGSHKAITVNTINASGDVTIAGVSVVAGVQADAAAAAADRIAAEQAAAAADIDRIAAEAAWTAALAANPDLNPQVRMNPSIVTSDLSIPDNFNAYASGPLEVAMGVTITVGANANLNII